MYQQLHSNKTRTSLVISNFWKKKIRNFSEQFFRKNRLFNKHIEKLWLFPRQNRLFVKLQKLLRLFWVVSVVFFSENMEFYQKAFCIFLACIFQEHQLLILAGVFDFLARQRIFPAQKLKRVFSKSDQSLHFSNF